MSPEANSPAAPLPERMTLAGASCVAMGMRGLLITGAPGAGKSSLALRLIALGARLVADDGVVLRRAGGCLLAAAPASIAGRIEARGIGLVSLPRVRDIPLELHVDLDQPAHARLPAPCRRDFLGVGLRSLAGRDLPGLAPALAAILGPGGSLLEIP